MQYLILTPPTKNANRYRGTSDKFDYKFRYYQVMDEYCAYILPSMSSQTCKNETTKTTRVTPLIPAVILHLMENICFVISRRWRCNSPSSLCFIRSNRTSILVEDCSLRSVRKLSCIKGCRTLIFQVEQSLE